MKNSKHSNLNLIKIIFLLSLCYSLVMIALFINAPFHEEQSFRQSQTALTTYWLPITHQWFFYQTPVLGYPWTIPFEFPIYQWTVAIFHKIPMFNFLNLDGMGRAVSSMFMYLTLIPIYFLLKLFGFPKRTFYLAGTFFLACPTVITWGGHIFLIESCILFLSLSYLTLAAYFLTSRHPIFLYSASLMGILAIIGKVTTFTPAAVFVFVLLLMEVFKDLKARNSKNIFALFILKKYLLPAVLLFLFPLIAEVIWTHLADALKSGNAVGATLTSKALFLFNFGTPSERVSLHILFLLFLKKALGIMPTYFILIGLALYFRKKTQTPWPTLSLVFLLNYLSGPMIFTHLYLQEQYWFETAVYLILGSTLLLEYLYLIDRTKLATGLLIFTVLVQVAANNPPKFLRVHEQAWSDRDYQIGLFIRDHTPPNSFILNHTDNWSSEIGYYAERKSFTGGSLEPLKNLSFYQGGLPLSAITFCGSPDGATSLLSTLRSTYALTNVHEIEDCKIYYSNRS